MENVNRYVGCVLKSGMRQGVGSETTTFALRDCFTILFSLTPPSVRTPRFRLFFVPISPGSRAHDRPRGPKKRAAYTDFCAFQRLNTPILCRNAISAVIQSGFTVIASDPVTNTSVTWNDSACE